MGYQEPGTKQKSTTRKVLTHPLTLLAGALGLFFGVPIATVGAIGRNFEPPNTVAKVYGSLGVGGPKSLTPSHFLDENNDIWSPTSPSLMKFHKVGHVYPSNNLVANHNGPKGALLGDEYFNAELLKGTKILQSGGNDTVTPDDIIVSLTQYAVADHKVDKDGTIKNPGRGNKQGYIETVGKHKGKKPTDVEKAFGAAYTEGTWS